MLTFSFVLFPAVLAAYWVTKKLNPLVLIFSVLTASVVSFIRGFFVFPKEFEALSVFQVALEFFIPMVLIPAFFFVLFLLFSKDDIDSKIKVAPEFLLAFFMVVMPFEATRNFSVYNFYIVFLRPLVYLAFCFATGNEIIKLHFGAHETGNKNKKNAAFCLSLLLIFGVAGVCFLDTTYFLSLSRFFAIPIAIVFIVAETLIALRLNKLNRPYFQNSQSPSSAEQVPD